MADNITMIDPSLRVPEVPTNPRMEVNGDLAQGLLDFARGVDRIAKAQGLFAQGLREERQKAAADPDTDWKGKTTRFRKRATEIRERLLADPATAPGTPEERQAFDADADRIEQAQAGEVEREGFEQAVPAIRDRLFASLYHLAGDAVLDETGRPDARLRRVAVENIRRHADAGIIGEGEVDRAAAAFDAAVQETAARRMASRDPAAAVAALDSGGYPMLSDGRRQELRDEFDTAARAKAASVSGDLDAALNDLKSAYEGKTLPSREVVDTLARLADQAGNAEAARAAAAADAGLSFATKLGRMPVADGVKLWKELEASPERTPERDAALAFGAARLNDMDKRLKTDPLGFAAEQGFADVEPIDVAQAAPEQLVQRAKTARMVAAFYRLPEPQFLTAGERQAMAGAFRAAEPADKLRMMTAVQSAFGGPSASKLFRETEGIAPAEAHFATLGLYGGGRDQVARRGFEGQRAIREKAVTLPPDSDFAAVEQRQIGAMFDARLSRTRATLIQAARALYAERMISRGIEGFDPMEYTRALDEAAGRGEPGGGIGVRNGRRIMLPVDMTQDQLNGLFDMAQDGDLAKLSVTGGAPVHVTLSGKVMPATAEDLRKAYPVMAGYGRFRLSMTDPAEGAPQFLADAATGGFYELDLATPEKRQGMAVGSKMTMLGRAGVRLDPVYPPKPEPVPKDQSRVPMDEPGQAKLYYDRVPEG